MSGVLRSEDTPRNELWGRGYESVEVAVSDYTLGHMISKQGDEVDLSKILPQRLQKLGEPQFNAVYFRTEDGNIYRLAVVENPKEPTISLTDAKKSKQTGAEEGILFRGRDVTNFIANNALIIGHPFISEKYPPTDPVTEIVLIELGMNDPDVLKTRTSGRVNSIMQDFRSMVYPKPESK